MSTLPFPSWERDLTDFTLVNARRFYLASGDALILWEVNPCNWYITKVEVGKVQMLLGTIAALWLSAIAFTHVFLVALYMQITDVRSWWEVIQLGKFSISRFFAVNILFLKKAVGVIQQILISDLFTTVLTVYRNLVVLATTKQT